MTSPCPEGLIRLGFHSENPPFFFTGPSGIWKGLYYWKEIARLSNCDGLAMVQYDVLGTGQVYEESLLNGDILSGKTFSTLNALYFLERDPIVYSITLPATWYRAFLDLSDLLRFALFSFSIVFLVQEWSGYFNGNNLLTIPVNGTSYLTMVEQFHQKKRQLVVDSFEALFNDNESVIVFGGNSSFIYGTSVLERFNLTCEQSSRVGLFQEFEYYQYLSDHQLNEQCKLAQIQLGGVKHTGVAWLDQSLTDGSPYVFLIAKNGTRKVRERMDSALLTVYSADKVNDLLLTRSMPIEMFLTIERRKTNNDPQFHADPMSLTMLLFPILFLILGLLTSLIGFILEWVHFTYKKCTCL